MLKYNEWIDSHVKSYEDAYGKCWQVCDLMLKEFQELILVRGHYYCSVWGEREHWWLKTADNKIIDPTKIQFPSFGFGEYIELDNSEPQPTGKCPNCGEYCYNSDTMCSKVCETEYMSYINGGLYGGL